MLGRAPARRKRASDLLEASPVVGGQSILEIERAREWVASAETEAQDVWGRTDYTQAPEVVWEEATGSCVLGRRRDGEL